MLSSFTLFPHDQFSLNGINISMNDEFLKNEKFNLKINPSTIYRLFLIILFFGEILIFSYYYSSKAFVTTWKTYLFIAILFPIFLIFITGTIFESFSIFFFNDEKKDENDNTLKFDNIFLSFWHFFLNLPFLVRLLIAIIAIIICYYIKNISFASISMSTVKMLIYILFASLLVFIIMFFVYVAVCMIFNYKMNLKKLELYYVTNEPHDVKNIPMMEPILGMDVRDGDVQEFKE